MKIEPLISQNPLAEVALTQMRDVATSSADFRQACHLLGTVLATECAPLIPVDHKPVETPLETTQGTFWQHPICLIPILRAGFGLLNPFHAIYPEAMVGQIGISRDEETLEANVYLEKLPDSLPESIAIVIDPMLATGHSAVAALKRIQAYKPIKLFLVCALAAPEGVKEIQSHFPEIQLVIGSLDRELNDQGFILPGLGDAGDRLFGTV
ncbi:MAG: uracil phosphoribosyltransferase [Verrucomicrobiota bacterium]